VLAVPRRALPCKKEICTRLFQPDFVALLIYRSIGRSPAIRSISFKCCSKATDFGSSQSAAQVLGVKPSIASAGSDLDFDNAFATVMQQTGRRSAPVSSLTKVAATFLRANARQ
jgi:hypothetical protein